MSLIDHPTGGYRFLPGIAPYSCGVVSLPGFEIVHVRFQQPRPYCASFERVAEFLAAAGRSRTALCGVALRSPRPYSFAGFANFNAEYAVILKDWGVFVDGINPIARTNVAPAINPPSETTMYSFSFTRPCTEHHTTFVVAGAGELPEGVLDRDQIVSLSNTSAVGMQRKADFVMSLMENRLIGLGVNWQSVNTINVYTVHPLNSLLPPVSAGIHGVNCYFTRPPIEEIEYEMDVRGTRTELIID